MASNHVRAVRWALQQCSEDELLEIAAGIRAKRFVEVTEGRKRKAVLECDIAEWLDSWVKLG